MPIEKTKDGETFQRAHLGQHRERADGVGLSLQGLHSDDPLPPGGESGSG